MRIVFMGTPEFACPALETLCRMGFRPQLVITQPPARRSRRGEAVSSPVGQLAQQLGLEFLETPRVSKGESLDRLREVQPDLIVVVAFGQILRESVLALAPNGCINLHPSKLPHYRGAAPIQSAILDGVSESAITIMRLVREMDAGPVLKQVPFLIPQRENAEEALARAAVEGAQVLGEVVQAFAQSTPPKEREQDHQAATFSRKLTKADGLIDFNRSATAVLNQIRGVTPWPRAYTFLPQESGGQRVMIHRATINEVPSNAEPGTIVQADKNGLRVTCAQGSLDVEEVQFEGKSRIPAQAAINGGQLKVGMVLQSIVDAEAEVSP